MDTLNNLLLGFSVALEPWNLLFCFIGTVVGTFIGVLPGLGPIAAIALLLPLTFKMAPAAAIIMLAGIYYGAMYGGSTTSILVNIPGEAASVVTCLDGYQMALQGRAGPALGIAAFGSFIAGTIGLIGLVFFAPVLGQAAIGLGPPEYFALTFLGLTLVSYLSRGSILKALLMAILGLWVGTVGMDPISGIERFSYGSLTLGDGLGLVPVAMGLFGIAEVLDNLGKSMAGDIYSREIKGLLPSREDWRHSFWPIMRGSFVGFFIGILPGPSGAMSSFASYAMEKRLSPRREMFGKGAIEGVAGPESANNAATAGAFIPLLSLGFPSNVVMALFVGALLIHGIQPGPLFMKNHPDLFWGVVASMYVGNIMLLVLNLPLIGIWVRLLRVPYVILYPLILLFCLIGVYSVNNNVVEIFIMIVCGVVGLWLRRSGFDGAPFLLALVLGPLMESSLRQSLLISRGSFAIFFNRPVAAVLMVLSCIFLMTSLLPVFRSKRDRLTAEVGDE
ncbi:MAG: tripartite tricarboxylate transporter permease [Candidatus Binatia bacterium]|jgi:putative tricarboxylic transport membrane protein